MRWRFATGLGALSAMAASACSSGPRVAESGGEEERAGGAEHGVRADVSPASPLSSAARPSGDVAPSSSSPTAESAAPPSTLPEALVVLERQRCRSTAPAYRLSIFADGRLTFEGEANVLVEGIQRDAIPAADARALADRLVAAGVAGLGHARCEPSDDRRCSMHPCTLALRVASEGRTVTASRADDASTPAASFLAASADVERTARLWRWVRPGLTADAANECATATDCTVSSDRCGGLHGHRAGGRAAEVGDCAASTQPKGGVEPACVGGSCALAPVFGDDRTCRSDGECMAVVSGCGSWSAIRRDPERVRQIAIRNDHKRCASAPPAKPPVACLRGTCVTRAPR